MAIWREFNNNPISRRVGDCAVRAVSLALGVPWERAYVLLVSNAYDMADMPSSDAVIGSVLRQNGFYRAVMPDSCPDCYTAEDFVHDNPDGTFVLFFGGHVATIIDGQVWDAFDSTQEVPIFVWYRKDHPPFENKK